MPDVQAEAPVAKQIEEQINDLIKRGIVMGLEAALDIVRAMDREYAIIALATLVDDWSAKVTK